MKKLLLSLFAVAALFSCSKSDVIYLEEQSEIGFAPVAQNVTKSVAGYNGDTFDGVFPTEIDLYVFANAGTGENLGNDTHTEYYFKNALFEWNSSKGSEDAQDGVATTGAYAGTPTRYWPNVKTLVFAGYSDACGVEKTTPTMDFTTNTLTIPSYTQNNSNYTAEGANDLMYFLSDGTAYSKQADEIAASMKHACSWITIKVAGDAVTAAANNAWKLKSLTVKSLKHSGNAVCDATNGATWTLATDDTGTDETYFTNENGVALETDAKKYESIANNFIVLPQEPTELEVTYTYVSDDKNNIITTETKSVSLDYVAAGTAWQSGVHYIYTITITATEILIDPIVVDWTEYDSDTNTNGNQPVVLPNL